MKSVLAGLVLAAVVVLPVHAEEPGAATLPAPGTAFPQVEPSLSRDQVRDLQLKLGALGYPVGRTDGVMGAKTRKAVADFQRHEHLQTTGHLNDRTVAALEAVGAPTAGTR